MLNPRLIPAWRRAIRAGLMLAAAFWLAAPASAGSVKFTDAGADAQRRLTLENDFLKVVIDPSCGGQIVSLVYKPTGTEMTRPPGADAMGGLLSDGVWEQSYWHSDWNRAPYAVEVLKQDATTAEVRLTATGRLWAGLTISKTIRLLADKPVVEADYEFSPGVGSDKRAKPDFWFHQTFGPPGRVFFPSPAGVVEGPGPGQALTTVFEPERGWAGFISDKGVGMGAAMEFDRLRFFTAEHQNPPTLEWVMRKAPMSRNSHRISTPVRLVFFTGLDRVDAVGQRAAVALELGKPDGGHVPVTVKVAATDNLSATLTLEVVNLETGKAAPGGDRKLDLQAGKTGSFDVSAPVDGQGTFVIRGTIPSAGLGGSDLKFERPIIVGKPGPAYAMAPEGQAIAEVDDSPTWSRYKPIDLNFNRDGYVTPHRNWGRPAATGKLKVLALMTDHDARQAVELAERFDFDLTCPYMCGDTYFLLGDGVRSLARATVDANVDKAVDGDYDVVLLNNYSSWGLLTDKSKKKLIERLRAGTGMLMMCRGDGPDDLKAQMPMTFLGYEYLFGAYGPGSSKDPVLHGIPLGAFPWMRMGNGGKLKDMAAAPNVEELVYSPTSKLPMVAADTVGKGRLVESMLSTTILPPINYEMTQAPFDYWEYEYAMVGRLLYWAARKDLPVRVDAVEVTRRKATIRLVSVDLSGSVTAHVVLRDRAGAAIQEADLPATVASGQTAEVELAPTASAAGRVFLADVVVSDARGVVGFGAGALPPEPSRIASIAVDKTAYDRTDHPKATIKLTAEPPAGSKLSVGVYDGSGRWIGGAEADAHKETAVDFPIDRAIGPMFEARVELSTPAGTADLADCDGIIRVPRPGAKFESFFWGGAFTSEPSYMADIMVRRYLDVGVTSNFGNNDADMPFFDRYDLPFRVTAGGMYMVNGATPEMLKKDPNWKGSFCDPADIKAKFDAGVNGGKQGVDRNVLTYSLGDENRGPGPDVDFSKIGLDAFRVWLKETQYKSLDELNAAWKTDFPSWDQVMPMTEAEIKKFGPAKGSYGAWSDQRQFNKVMYARHGAACTAGVLSVDKQGMISVSGTQEPGAYGGRDWSLLSKSYNSLMAYGGVQENEEMTFNPDMIRYQWTGWGKPNPLYRGSNWNIMGKNNKGIGIFADNSIIDPDLTLCEIGRDTRQTLAEFNTGAGQLAADALMVNDRVMVLQSPASIAMAYITNQRGLDQDSRYGIMTLTDSLSLVYNPISYAQLADGHLSEAAPKVLFLPYSVALSSKEVEQITKWVNAGGTLISDLQPGIMSEHGLVLPRGQLDELMGVDRSGAAVKNGKWEVQPGGSWIGLRTPFIVGNVEAGVKAAGATALWSADSNGHNSPVVFHHKVGQGQTYYLAFDGLGANAVLASHALERGSAAMANASLQLFADLLASGGVRPRMGVTVTDAASPTGNRIAPFLWVRPKAIGSTQVYVILRDYNISAEEAPDQWAQARLAQGGYIYDALAGRFLGHGDRLDLPLSGNTVRLLTVLPYYVTGIDIGPASITAKPGQDVTINARLRVEGDAKLDHHVFHIDVARPDGTLARLYSGDTAAVGGEARFTIPLAVNDPPGAWRIRVHDAATGAAADTTLNVQVGE